MRVNPFLRTGKVHTESTIRVFAALVGSRHIVPRVPPSPSDMLREIY
jgi:hypothetical protein